MKHFGMKISMYQETAFRFTYYSDMDKGNNQCYIEYLFKIKIATTNQFGKYIIYFVFLLNITRLKITTEKWFQKID